MDREALRNLTWYWLDDTTGDYFTQTQVNTFLNNAQRQVQKILIQSFENRYIYCKQTSLVAGQAFYLLPSDFMKVNRLVVVLSGTTEATEDVRPLEYVTPNQDNLYYSTNGTPSSYTILGDKFRLYPIPDSVLTMRMYYSYRVTDMTQDTDEPDVPEEYHEFIAILAAMDGFIKDGRDVTALMAKKAEYLEAIKQDAEERNVDSSRRVVITGGDYGTGGYY